MTEYQDLSFDKHDDVGILKLDREQRLNSLSRPMIMGALEILTTLSRDRSVRALVITGAGRGFCSGADLGDDTRLEDMAGSLGEGMKNGLNRLIMAICNAPFPVVSAVNGPAAGAGVGLALSADFLIAAESMRLLLTFSRIGMGLDGGTSWFLSHLLGQKRATAVSMLVEPITAQRAMDWGIAWSVVADEDVMTEAMGLASRLAEGATLAYAAQKKQLCSAMNMTLQEALDAEADVQDALIKTDDLKEGVLAFREGRPANYSGR